MLSMSLAVGLMRLLMLEKQYHEQFSRIKWAMGASISQTVRDDLQTAAYLLILQNPKSSKIRRANTTKSEIVEDPKGTHSTKLSL